MRLATFNIRHGARARGRRVDVAALVDACRGLRADVLALQEVDRGTRRVGSADLAAAVAEGTGMAFAFGRTLTHRGGDYGNALFVRGEVDDVERRPLPAVGEPRGVIVATAVVAGSSLTVAATHLSTRRRESGPQLAAVLDALAGRPRPRVLLGDLNRVPAELSAGGGELAWAGGPPTYPSRRPVLRIDHVAVDGLTVESVEVVRAAVSDHRALVVTAEVSSVR
jgi:endonuclease/exonuclease/phosphatase family metal-dependent hydrolase